MVSEIFCFFIAAHFENDQLHNSTQNLSFIHIPTSRKFEARPQWHLLKLLELVIAAPEPQSSALWMPAVRRFGQARDDDDFGLK